jgi:hypothetical protein
MERDRLQKLVNTSGTAAPTTPPASKPPQQ